MPGRRFIAGTSAYRYGFNGKENDKDAGEGIQDYGMRIYDGRLGKFLSVDPYGGSYPYYSSYQFSGNTPIQAIDLDGGEPVGYSTSASYRHPGNEWIRVANDIKLKSNAVGKWYEMMIKDANGDYHIVYRQETAEIATFGSNYNRLVNRVDFYYLDNNCNAPAPGQNFLTEADGKTFVGNFVGFDAQERTDAKSSSAIADAGQYFALGIVAAPALLEAVPAVIAGGSAAATSATNAAITSATHMFNYYWLYGPSATAFTNNYLVPFLDESGGGGGLRQVERLTYKTGQKLGEQIARWIQKAGGKGGVNEFLDYATDLANRALMAGTYVTGKVGELDNARIFRDGTTYLVEHGGKVMSYVPNAEEGKGIVEVYKNLGGK